jgi:hypothetical protein
MSSLAVALELRARMRKPSVQQPWKAHVPTVSEIEGPVAVGLMDVDVVLVVVEETLKLAELVIVEVLELVVLVEVDREVVIEEQLVVDVVYEDMTEVERDVVVAVVTLDTDDRPTGPPAPRELNEETIETPDDVVADDGRLTVEDVVADDSALRDGALDTIEGNVLEDTTLEDTELEIDEVVLVVVVEARELEEIVEKVVHVVEVLELVLDDTVDELEPTKLEVVELEVVNRKPELTLLVEELIAELLELPELERLVALLVAEEDVCAALDVEVEALLRPPAILRNTLSEVLKELVEELADVLLEAGAEVVLPFELVLVEATFEVELPEVDTPLEEPPPVEAEDESWAFEELDVPTLLMETIGAELDTERAALEEVATEEPTLLVDDKAAIEVDNELL